MFSLEEALLGLEEKLNVSDAFLLFCIDIYFKHTSSGTCVVVQQGFGFWCRGEQKITVSFCFQERLSQTMKNFSIQFGGLEGHPCHRAQTRSLSDFPFPVQLRESSDIEGCSLYTPVPCGSDCTTYQPES